MGHHSFEFFQIPPCDRKELIPISRESDVARGPIKQTESELIFKFSYQKTQS